MILHSRQDNEGVGATGGEQSTCLGVRSKRLLSGPTDGELSMHTLGGGRRDLETSLV